MGLCGEGAFCGYHVGNYSLHFVGQCDEQYTMDATVKTHFKSNFIEN